MKQIIRGKTYGFLGAAPANAEVHYTILRGGPSTSEWQTASNKFLATHPWSVAGTFSRLYVAMLGPVENGSDQVWADTTFTLYVNDVATALTVTVPAAGPVTENGFQASAANTVDTVTVAPGDRLSMRRDISVITGVLNGLAANMEWSLTFDSTNAGESSYGSGAIGTAALGGSNISTSAPLSGTAYGFYVGSLAVTDITAHSIVPLEGSIVRIDVVLDVAPGVGATRTFLMAVNGVQQDGSGGTVDTRLAITGAATSGSVTFTLPVHVLDYVSLYHLVPSGSPAAAHATSSIGVHATTDGQSALCFDSRAATPINDGSTDWCGQNNSGWAWTTASSPTPAPAWRPDRYPSTELLVSLPGSIDAHSLSHLCVNLAAAPGSAKTFSFTTRNAFADTASVNVMTGTGTGTAVLNQGTGSADFTGVSARLDLQCVGTGTPSTGAVGWAWLMTTDETPPVPVVETRVTRRLRRFPLPSLGNLMQFLQRIEFVIQGGVGLTTGLGSDPVIMMRISRDGGFTWGNELQMGLGKQGAYNYRAYLQRLGRGRQFVVEVTCTDPVKVVLLDCLVDLETGTA